MAERDAERLRRCGWRVLTCDALNGPDEPTTLHVFTYKPTTLFGELGAVYERGTYLGDDLHEHGIVSWSLACGCEAAMLQDDSSARGMLLHLQPLGADGRAFFPSADYVIERVSWPCFEQSSRASVAVRLPGEDSWRGRSIMVDVAELRSTLAAVPA